MDSCRVYAESKKWNSCKGELNTYKSEKLTQKHRRFVMAQVFSLRFFFEREENKSSCQEEVQLAEVAIASLKKDGRHGEAYKEGSRLLADHGVEKRKGGNNV